MPSPFGGTDTPLPGDEPQEQEEADPCPPDMLWEMLLRSVVHPRNEISMRRQVSLWECCERKLRSGSYLDSPFAVEHS